MCSKPNMKRGKIFILSAPSGTGKSTIIRELMKDSSNNLEFSISATSRAPRGGETHGKEYYFLTLEQFNNLIDEGEFVEWEEVYEGTKYGTLRSEIERITDSGKNVIMDIDVKGALNIKRQFGSEAIALFILPPSLRELEMRLRSRNTDSEDSLKHRLEKAEYEMSFADQFDHRVINDFLSDAVGKVSAVIHEFID